MGSAMKTAELIGILVQEDRHVAAQWKGLLQGETFLMFDAGK